MGDETRRKQRLRSGRAVAAVVGVAMVASACSGSGSGSSRSSSGNGSAVGDCLSSSQCYGPIQFRVAYGIQPLLDERIDGRGQTVVLLEWAAPAPASPPRVTDIRGDLARLDSVFGLPAADLQVDNNLAHSPSPWLANGEEVEDTEIVHAVAPDADIRVVLISDAAGQNPATLSPATVSADVAAALRVGVSDGAVISYSHSWGERCFTAGEVTQLDSALQTARNNDVTVVNSSGDFGASANPCRAGTAVAVKGVNLMASDPLVLAAGGSSLQANRKTGAYLGETVWSTPAQTPAGFSYTYSSGGGLSELFPRPDYQSGLPGIGAARGVPDVAGDADNNTGMALATTDGGQNYILTAANGTSAAAPLWAAVIALADQYAGRHLGFVNPAIYRIGRSAAYHAAFHDITSGTNTVRSSAQTVAGYQAGPGWDPVTGWGSPDAQVLVPLLARNASQ
jgi:subtilase family serine protease